MKKYLKLLRVTHWLKNGLIFLPIIFSGNLFNSKLLILTIIGFVSFSLLSSTIYINNDIQDIQSDKKHPRKKHRPLPSGEISIKEANIIKYILLAIVIIIVTIIATQTTIAGTIKNKGFTVFKNIFIFSFKIYKCPYIFNTTIIFYYRR